MKRKRVFGTAERPRLVVFRSLKNTNAQIIDDTAGVTMISASTSEKGMEKNGANIKAAQFIGKLIAERALAKGINKVVFDRAGFLYHGRVKALADAAREGGLQF
jgi:large subunit ribosomal protein L18